MLTVQFLTTWLWTVEDDNEEHNLRWNYEQLESVFLAPHDLIDSDLNSRKRGFS